MTGEPGAECPQCGRRLTSELCQCGWRPSSASSSAGCVDCATSSALSLDDDGELRCAACHVEYLRARAARDPISAEELEQCRASIRASLARLAAGRRADVDRGSEPPGVRAQRVPSGEQTDA